MFQILQILSIVLVAVGVALSLAHALELPGKLRLDKDAYIAVQSVYYPGFTIGGVFGELGAILVTLVLLVLTPFASTAFWLTLSAFVALLIMHGLYWVLIHPVIFVQMSSSAPSCLATYQFRNRPKNVGTGRCVP